MNADDYCVACGCELLELIDDDPNGDRNPKCARCRAEEAHDFDVEPQAVFNRQGSRIDE